MTAEELAAKLRTDEIEYVVRKLGGLLNAVQVGWVYDALGYAAQAQRIAELEAHLAARGPDREAIVKSVFAVWAKAYESNLTLDDARMVGETYFDDTADAILSSGALATAQAEQRTMADAGKDSLEYIQATKAAHPTQEGEKL